MTIVGLSCIVGTLACGLIAAVFIGAGATALVALAIICTVVALADMEASP